MSIIVCIWKNPLYPYQISDKSHQRYQYMIKRIMFSALQVISEYCRTRLQARPFTQIVMEMYREVVRSPQYAARKRAAYYQLNVLCPARNIDQSNHEKIYGHHHPQRQQDHVQLPSFQHQLHVGQHLSNQLTVQQRQQQQQQQQQDHTQFSINQFRSLQQQQNYAQYSQDHRHNHHHHYYGKGAHFRAQSRNSLSHPNLSSLCGSQQQHGEVTTMNACRTQFQSQLDIQSGSRSIGPASTHHQRRIHHHSRTYSQPVYTLPQHTRSSGNLPMTTNATTDSNPDKNIYNDPIYALPVKPFLSSQDVRVNGLMAKAIRRGDDIHDRSSSISRYAKDIILVCSFLDKSQSYIHIQIYNILHTHTHTNIIYIFLYTFYIYVYIKLDLLYNLYNLQLSFMSIITF